jgi:hypothetical protein
VAVKSIVFVDPPVGVVPDVDVLDGVSLDVVVDASALVPFFDFPFFVVPFTFEAFVVVFALAVLDFASFTDAFALVLFALPPFARLALGFVVLTFDTDAFGAGLFTAPPFGG